MKKSFCIVTGRKLKANWYFPISAMAFFVLNAMLTPGYLLGLPMAFLATVIVAGRTESMWEFVRRSEKSLLLLSLLTALGICWCSQSTFYAAWSSSAKVEKLLSLLPSGMDIPRLLSLVGAVAAFFFVFICLLFFWREILRIFKENPVFSGVSGWEWAFYAGIVLLTLLLTVAAFTGSEAFYGAAQDYDLIYTSDSPCLVKGDVYLLLTHQENDIRQPLFALFSAPFLGIPWLLAKLMGMGACGRALVINAAQILMLLCANFILCRMLKLNAFGRVAFMAFSCCSYTYLLFVIMMEQYLVGYFWLILCLYLWTEQGQTERLAFWGACGTLMTGAVLLPLLSQRHPLRQFKAWFMDMLKYGLEFLALVLAFCRFDIFFDLLVRGEFLQQYAGGVQVEVNKFWQYSAFVRNCFAAPETAASEAFGSISWQLAVPTGVSLGGVLILVLAFISALWNREKKSSRAAAAWAAFSLAVLLLLGWGTQENGLILYSLYFGWTFFVLLWQLVEKIGDVLKIRALAPALALATAAVLAVINVPAICELLSFAAEHYPA